MNIQTPPFFFLSFFILAADLSNEEKNVRTDFLKWCKDLKEQFGVAVAPSKSKAPSAVSTTATSSASKKRTNDTEPSSQRNPSRVRLEGVSNSSQV